jgi:predicted transposase YbfD/YdcC
LWKIGENQTQGEAMSQTAIATIQEHFSVVQEPRVEYLVEHNLSEMIVIAICAVICGANDWVAVADWGEAKIAWLKQYLKLENEIPSHDCYRRLFLRIDPEQFQKGFMSWIQAVFTLSQGQVIAVDGKEMNGSKSKTLGRRAIDRVSAWATANRLVLGQRKVEEKSNEITAIPALLQLLDLEGCLVTIDAMGCQTEIAAQVVEQGGDYLLAVKANQGHLHEDIEFLFACAQHSEFKGIDSDYAQTVSQGHGRIEKRECWIIDDRKQLDFIRDRDEWAKLQTIVMIRAHRQEGSKATTQVHYFISSLQADARQLLAAKRAHWGIENQLHWTLDVAFREDDHQLGLGHGPANFALLRQMAASLLKQENTAKCGIANKRLRAAWDDSYLLKVLHPG